MVRPGNSGDSGLSRVWWSQLTRLRSAAGWLRWMVSYSIGVHSEARVASLSVVEDLKVLEDRIGEFDAGLPSFPVQQFDLHPGPERFDHRVVEAIADRSHRREQPGLFGPSGERPRRELP